LQEAFTPPLEKKALSLTGKGIAAQQGPACPREGGAALKFQKLVT
jgi:hypothetical protein